MTAAAVVTDAYGNSSSTGIRGTVTVAGVVVVSAMFSRAVSTVRLPAIILVASFNGKSTTLLLV